jgi:hypothetical protein
MSQTTITAYHYVDGVLTDATSAILSDSTGTWGVRRTDYPDGDPVVLDGTAMTRISTGVYQYSFEDPAYDLTYEYSIEFLYSGITTRFSETIDGTPSGTAAAGSILELVQASADIATNDAAHVANLIEVAQRLVAAYCGLPVFPSLSQGYSMGRAGAETNLSGLAHNGFSVSVGGSLYETAELTLANCTTGALTAAEMQTQIRAIAPADSTLKFLFATVTVAYNATSGRYTVTAPTWGRTSWVNLGVDADDNVDVIQALGLTPLFGGIERQGAYEDDRLNGMVAALVVDAYRASQIAPKAYSTTTSRTALADEVWARMWDAHRTRFLPWRRL